MTHYHCYLRALGRGGMYIFVALYVAVIVIVQVALLVGVVAVDGVGARAGYGYAAPLFGAGAGAHACRGAYGGHAGVVGGHVAAGGAGGVVIVVVGLLFHHGAAGEGEVLGAHKAAGAVIVRIQEAAGAVGAQHGEGLAPHIAQLGSALGGAGGGRADVDVVVLGYGALGLVVHIHAGGRAAGGAGSAAAGGQVGKAYGGAVPSKAGEGGGGYPAGDVAYGHVYLSAGRVAVVDVDAAAYAYGVVGAVDVYGRPGGDGGGIGTGNAGGRAAGCGGGGAGGRAAGALVIAYAGDGGGIYPALIDLAISAKDNMIHVRFSVLPVYGYLAADKGFYIRGFLGLLIHGGLGRRRADDVRGEGGKCGQHHQRQHGHCYDADNSLFHKRFPFRMSSYFSFSRDTSSSSSNTKAARRGS